MVFFSAAVSLPERYQIVNEKSAIESGIVMLPVLGVAGFGSFFAGRVNQKKNNTFWTLIVCIPCLGVGIGLVSTISADIKLSWTAYIYGAILGVGFGPVVTVITMMSVCHAEYSDIGAVQGSISQIRIIGGTISLSLVNVILDHKLKSSLNGELTAEQLSTIEQMPEAFKTLPTAQANLVRETYSDGYKEVFRVLAFLCIACFFAAGLTYQRNPPPLGFKGKKEEGEAGEEAEEKVEPVNRRSRAYRDPEMGGPIRRGSSFFPLSLPEDFDMPFGLSEYFYRHISVYFGNGDRRRGAGAANRRSRFSRWMGGLGEGGFVWDRRARQKLPRGKTV